MWAVCVFFCCGRMTTVCCLGFLAGPLSGWLPGLALCRGSGHWFEGPGYKLADCRALAGPGFSAGSGGWSRGPENPRSGSCPSDLDCFQITTSALVPRACEIMCVPFKKGVSISDRPLGLLKVSPAGL